MDKIKKQILCQIVKPVPCCCDKNDDASFKWLHESLSGSTSDQCLPVMLCILLDDRFEIFRMWKHIWSGNTHADTRVHERANKRQLFWGSFIQSSVRWGQRTSACVFEHWKTERPHIQQGQKGYINTLYDYVSALISVPSPGEERGFCWSAAMTPLWLILPNTLYQLNRRRSAVSLALLCGASFGSAWKTFLLPAARPLSACTGTPWLVGMQSSWKGPKHTHTFMQASQNTHCLHWKRKTNCLTSLHGKTFIFFQKNCFRTTVYCLLTYVKLKLKCALCVCKQRLSLVFTTLVPWWRLFIFYEVLGYGHLAIKICLYTFFVSNKHTCFFFFWWVNSFFCLLLFINEVN